MTGEPRTTPTSTPAAARGPSSSPASRLRTKNPNQAGRNVSPWSLRERLGMLAWMIVCALFFRPSPKMFNTWRLFLLRVFGAKVSGVPFVHSACIIRIPWHLTIEDGAALAPGAEVYNLGHVTLRKRCVVSQQAYLCAGTHELSDPMLPLLVGDIEIGPEAFLGARAMVMPGVRIGEGAVLGAGGVAGKDLDAWTIYAGNPCKPIRTRVMQPRT